MNVNPGNKQRQLCDTVIPFSNPDPAPGKEDTHGQVQKMCFLDDHHKLELRGKPKRMKIVLQECKSVWDKYIALCNKCGVTVVRKCTPYTKSQSHKDAKRRIMLAEVAGQEGAPSAEDVIDAYGAPSMAPPTSDDEWCYMEHVLSLQKDFQTEKPLIQSLIKDAGHVCLFLPKFHCELNQLRCSGAMESIVCTHILYM